MRQGYWTVAPSRLARQFRAAGNQVAPCPARVYSSSDVIPTCTQNAGIGNVFLGTELVDIAEYDLEIYEQNPEDHEHHGRATPREIADALGIKFQVVSVILSKSKPKRAA